jgi:TRAP-type mannitol/chloroaromatic compound transport system permease large subunit
MTWEALTGLIMLLVLLGAIFIGVPISFTLLFLALTFGYFGMGATVFDLAYFQTIGMMKEELLAWSGCSRLSACCSRPYAGPCTWW